MTGDTISAVATAPGEGGIGIIRISGNKAAAIAEDRDSPLSQQHIRVSKSFVNLRY